MKGLKRSMCLLVKLPKEEKKVKAITIMDWKWDYKMERDAIKRGFLLCRKSDGTKSHPKLLAHVLMKKWFHPNYSYLTSFWEWNLLGEGPPNKLQLRGW